MDKAFETIEGARKRLAESEYNLDTESYWFELYDERFNPASDTSEFDLYFPTK